MTLVVLHKYIKCTVDKLLALALVINYITNHNNNNINNNNNNNNNNILIQIISF